LTSIDARTNEFTSTTNLITHNALCGIQGPNSGNTMYRSEFQENLLISG